tara:strand:- start:91 stop:1194 length:1104 start_codon:yes stop_codon:yes gene_type:complete
MKKIIENWRNHLEEEEIIATEATLSFAQLAKSQQRMAAFIDKLEKELPFKIKGEEDVTFIKDEQIINALKNMLSSGDISAANAKKQLGRNFTLRTTDGRTLSIGKLLKTPEFGGKGSDFYVKKEIAARGQLESLIIGAIKNANTDAITLRVRNSKGEVIAVYDDVIGIKDTSKVAGVDPKSDFELIRKDNKPIVYISHKDGVNAKAFGQWSGISPKAGDKIHNHPEVKKFIQDLQPYLVNDGEGNMVYPKGLSFGRKIQDTELKLMSIYGQDYTASGPGSPNNVDLVAQGLFSIKTVGVNDEQNGPEVVYDLSAHHLLARLDPEVDFGEEYTPALVSRFATARRNFGIKFLRATIYPIGGRKIAKMI